VNLDSEFAVNGTSYQRPGREVLSLASAIGQEEPGMWRFPRCNRGVASSSL
jgi:hypothetical protein